MFLDAGTDHNAWVKTAMGAKAAGLDFEDFHDWSARAGNYSNEAECRSVWRSIKEGAIGAGSLFHAARAAGWTDGAEAPANAHNRTKRGARRQSSPSPRRMTRAPCGTAASRPPSTRNTSNESADCPMACASITAR
jgi:hypothetical protein